RDGRIVQIGTPEDILTDPANDYVAQFVQDVDRARVLTAASAMEPVRAVVSDAAGPRAALRQMRDLQTSAAFVVGRGKVLLGVVRDQDVMNQVKAGITELSTVIESDVAKTTADMPLAELYDLSVSSDMPIAVVDDKNRLLGVIPRVTLLASIGNVDTSTGELPALEPPATIPVNVITQTLLESAPDGEETTHPDAVPATEGATR
ncbi:MAG: glycine betaine ABC transporter ATP-binding protein, partial [Rhodoglobus sp.]|nr:glycine betaine ABC transporter ATP-binding protein [Rhodoglobus sp.]